MLGASEVSRSHVVTNQYHTYFAVAGHWTCKKRVLQWWLMPCSISVTLFSISAVDEGDGLKFLLEFAMMVIVSCKRYLILMNILFSSSPSFCILIWFDWSWAIAFFLYCLRFNCYLSLPYLLQSACLQRTCRKYQSCDPIICLSIFFVIIYPEMNAAVLFVSQPQLHLPFGLRVHCVFTMEDDSSSNSSTVANPLLCTCKPFKATLIWCQFCQTLLL